MRDKGTSAIIFGAAVVIAFGLGVLLGGQIANNHAERENGKADARALAITNAVTAGILEAQEPLTCKDAAIIEVVRSLVKQGVHVKHFTLGVKMDDKLESEVINDEN
jgi:hypothetical protein